VHRVEVYVIDGVYERFILDVWGFVLSMTSKRIALASGLLLYKAFCILKRLVARVNG